MAGPSEWGGLSVRVNLRTVLAGMDAKSWPLPLHFSSSRGGRSKTWVNAFYMPLPSACALCGKKQGFYSLRGTRFTRFVGWLARIGFGLAKPLSSVRIIALSISIRRESGPFTAI